MLAEPVNLDLTNTPVSGYVPLRVSALRSIDTTAVDLFLQYERNSAPVLYCRAGFRVDQQRLLELADSGVEHVYVRREDFHSFGNDLLDSLDKFLHRDTVPQTEKFAALQVAFAVEIEQTIRLVDCGKFHTVAERVGRNLVFLLATSDVLPRDLFRIARHDFNTFTHVTNTASYSIILAEQLGISDREELEQIAAGAMLHDIGKRFLPPALLAKRSPLTTEEREIIQTHPVRGYEELCDRPGLDFGQLMMVYQHHEHVDGTGYPVNILADEIHPWAKLLTVVDVFDGLTSKRPHRRPATVEEALDYQRQRAGTYFDREVIECWISAMSKT
jgi:HD-GYP domain-containing protein (c-di-GMP phosphodiesterase class II)